MSDKAAAEAQPRLSNRGPIEALTRFWCLLCRYSPNHGYPTVDPLKHKRLVEANSEVHAQPRLSNRGPIEAGLIIFSSDVFQLPNHGYPTVDPLKQGSDDPLALTLAPNHGYPTVDPLKPGCARRAD